MNKNSLYLTDYEKETIKNENFYKLIFFDTITGLVFKTHIHELTLKNDYLQLLTNGNKETIENLKKAVQ